VSRCIPPPPSTPFPAEVGNDNGDITRKVERLYWRPEAHVPHDKPNPLLTEADAVLSDVGSYEDWRALAIHLKESERGQQGGLTGVTKRKRKVTR
jgi:hypothetical protein